MIDKLLKELKEKAKELSDKHWGDDERHLIAKGIQCMYTQSENIIRSKLKDGGWIPCSERLPDEHDSIFAQFKDTDQWSGAMFEKISDDVNVTVEFENGKRKTKTLHTIDGKWSEGHRGVKFKVVAWQPLPEEYHG